MFLMKWPVSVQEEQYSSHDSKLETVSSLKASFPTFLQGILMTHVIKLFWIILSSSFKLVFSG